MGNPLTSATRLAAVPIGVLIGLGECDTFTFKIPRVANDSVFWFKWRSFLVATLWPGNWFSCNFNRECGFWTTWLPFIMPTCLARLIWNWYTIWCNTSLMLDASGNDFTNWMWVREKSHQNDDTGSWELFSWCYRHICQITHSDTIVITIDSSTVVILGDQGIGQGETVSFSAVSIFGFNWSSPGSLDLQQLSRCSIGSMVQLCSAGGGRTMDAWTWTCFRSHVRRYILPGGWYLTSSCLGQFCQLERTNDRTGTSNHLFI